MAVESMLSKPRLYYETGLKNQYHQAAEEYYESLGKKGNLDKAANASHVAAYNAALAELEAAKKKLGKAKAGKGWAIAGIIVSFIAAVILIVVGAMNASKSWWLILIGAAVAVAGILLIVLVRTRIKNAVAIAQKEVEEKEAKAKAALEVCYSDMAGLNALLDDAMPMRVMEAVTPIIDLDPTFTPARLCHLMDAFGMGEEDDPDTSVEGVLSGHIQGNPFVLEKVFRHEVVDKTYTGTLVITWTTTHRDSKGNTYTQTHTQTLTATAVHPAPSYWHETRLIFGSEVAPNLHFTRNPSGMSGASERQRNKFVKDRVKTLDRLEKDAIQHGGAFTKLGNDEFDAYWGADNRDNEVEYRVMFTPLAQTNELDLIKNPEPYGDDFVMVKDGMLTSIASRHSQDFDYYRTADFFEHFDFEAGKKNFVEYCDAFIRGLYFDLAPIMSIPLYQLHKPRDYIYGNSYGCNTTSFEHEVMINRLDRSVFMPDEADPDLPLLLKQAGARAVGGSDQVRVRSRSYHTTPMVDYIPVMGGDGRWHDVPVHWTQYDEVSMQTNVAVVDSGKNRSQWSHSSLDGVKKYLSDRGFHFERGLFAFWLGAKGSLTAADGDAIASSLRKE